MKKILIAVLLLAFGTKNSAQWQLSLTCKQNETIADISAPSNNIIWVITHNFFIYRTNNGDNNWQKIKCKGLTSEISILQLYVVNASTAFLCVDKNTGIGPGLIYKTTDSGSNWKQVFSHKGTCRIKLAMFNNNAGLMACSYDSFDGSVKPGQALYTTDNGGQKWHHDSVLHPKSFIMNLETKNNQVALTDYKVFYYSPNRDKLYPVIDKLKPLGEPKYNLQFEDSNYAILNAGNLVDILVKRPGTAGWIDEQTPPGVDNGAITAIVLDGNECWMTEAFDTNKLYYSSDSAKTFTSTVPVSNSSFQFLIKARKGKTLVGGTPSFMTGKIYINKRTATVQDGPIAFSR